MAMVPMMQKLVETNLTSVHDQSSTNKIWPKTCKIIFGIFLLCLIPYLHIGVFGYYVWPTKPTIDPSNCDCKCFDTVFRGKYEHQAVTNYKHWYFNSTLIAYKMWCLIVVGLIIAYECFKYILSCFMEKDIRYSMMVVFISSIFPHYYSWWNYLNYYNERFYVQWYHQLYFTVSEFISTAVVLYLMRRSRKTATFHILFILIINLSHIIIGGLDQFIENILYHRGDTSQVVRDFGLVVPDILAVGVVLYETKQLALSRRTSFKNLFYKEELLFAFFVTTAMVMIGKNL